LKSVGQQSALAHELEAARASDAARQSHEQSASATSGTYCRVPRASAEEAAPWVRGEANIDGAKIDGLRFELDVGVWRADSERVARCVIADAEYVAETDEHEA
jgi:hypothetical protein